MNKQAVILSTPVGALIPLDLRGMSLPALVKGRSATEARALVMDLKASLEERLEDEPNDYDALVLLGELNLRVGLCVQARALLYRASLQQPPSWEAFQRTSLLLRRAEEQQQKAFERVAGIAPPKVVRQLAASVTVKIRSVFSRRTESEASAQS